MNNLQKKIFYAVILLIGFTLHANAQKLNPETTDYRYWIYFKDKGAYKPGETLTPGSEGYNLAKSQLTEKAIWRRSKVLSEDKLVNYDDIPVNQAYIDGLRSLGLEPKATSKWFNAVSVITKKDKLEQAKKLGYVLKIEGVSFLEFATVPSTKSTGYAELPSYSFDNTKNKYDYGYSYWQNEQIKVPALHNIGVTGLGVTVGMCDDGFNWRTHQALKTRNVADEFDWINKDDSVQWQTKPNQLPADPFDQDGHGTATMSSLGGYAPGQLIGPAFDVEFYLSKTEKGETETPIEEDYWLEAIEWMEGRGAEVISSSLIYKPFDLPHNQYSYKDMDGKTTVIVRAAEHAAMLGVVVCNSMGNEEQTSPPSIVSPPDGADVFSIGAVDSAGRIAYFSSNGPTSDGRMKPDVVAMGVDVYTAASFSFTYDTAGYSYVSGTSFSCPITAGVCALILSVHPELTPAHVKEALHNTSSRKDNPNNVYGWGLVNSLDAALYHGMIMSNQPEVSQVGDNTKISMYAVSKGAVNDGSVKMFYSINGGEFVELAMGLEESAAGNGLGSNSGKYSISVPFGIDENVKFYFTASDDKGNTTAPYNAPSKFFWFNPESKKLEIY